MNNKILKKILGLFGYKAIDKELIKKNRLLSKKSFLTIDKLLENLFSKNKIKSLIQIGANDGQRFDTINYFIKTYNPSCLLVEPIKENFEKLKKNYIKFSKVKFDNSAITVGDEINYLYKVDTKFLMNYSDHIPGITSFDKNHLIKHGVKKTHIVKERVESITINNLILKHKLFNFDLLFVDVEGYDANIVIDFFSNTSLRPIIVLEYIHIKNDIFKNLVNILELNKYIFFSINENMICFPEEDKNLISFN
jgi:FkbM family methyltransferase